MRAGRQPLSVMSVAALVLTGVGIALPVAPAAHAVSIDGPTRACLQEAIGKRATAAIARASTLTAKQKRQVRACRQGASGSGSTVVWFNDGQGTWMPTGGTPPSCAGVAWQLPIDDLAVVDTVLDPGQVRGGRYKAHGGLRTTTSDVVVRSPIDGYLVAAAVYRELEDGSTGPGGERQVLLDIQNPCGLAVRFDHLRVLDPVIEKAIASVPVRDDSRTTNLTPIPVKRGQPIATRIGHVDVGVNRSFDFGAYDYRSIQPNRRSPAELAAFGPDGLLGRHALCWLDLFGPDAAQRLRTLPRTSTEAAQGSDVCSLPT